MQDRNFKISLIKATGSEIVKVIDFRSLVHAMLKTPKLLETGDNLAQWHKSDPARYDKEKRKQPGFMIGEFSYRNADNCITYESVLGFDIDHIPDRKTYDAIFEKFKRWPFTFVAMPSISRAGIRVLILTNCTKEKHPEYYVFAAKAISSMLGIPTKSAIKERLRELGYHGDYINKFLSENIHIDDATKDISRFWYYSGLRKEQIFVNKESAVLIYKDEVKIQVGHSGDPESSDYPYVFTEADKVEYLIHKIEQSRIDITKGVFDWFKLGLGLYDEFGHNGEGYFIRVSAFHPDASRTASEREWKRVVSKYRPGSVSISSFFKWCQDYGVEIDWNELVKQNADKFRKTKEEQKAKKVKDVKRAGLFQEDLETAIISTCIYHPEFIPSIFDVCPKFSANCFFDLTTKSVFESIQRLISEQMEVTPLSVRAKLQYQNVKADEIIEKYSQCDSRPEDFLTNIRIAYNLHLKRKVMGLGEKMVATAKTQDVDVFDYLNELYTDLNSLADYGSNQTSCNALQLATQLQKRYERVKKSRLDNGGILTGIPTGLILEDELTSGYQDTDLIILAARPGMGKTAKALKTALVNVIQGVPVGFFSLEMSSMQLGQRLIAILKNVRLKNIRNSDLHGHEQERFFKGLEDLSSFPLYIDDKGAADINHIDMTARKWKRQFGIRLIIVDYLQLIRVLNSKTNRHEQLGEMTKRLKILAKDLQIPILCLSQLSRAVEIRGGTKRPQLSDLRESGSIEEDADIVQFIYRPEYYNLLEDEKGNSLKGLAEIIFAKHRNGELTTVKCGFDAEYTEFLDEDNYNAVAVESNSMFSTPQKQNATITDDEEPLPF